MNRILVIDDEAVILDVLHRILENLGYTAFTAENEEMALALFREKTFDLVFIDVIMKEVSGFEIAGQFRADRPDQKIVMITGLGPESMLEKTLNEEVIVDGFLYKPFSLLQVKNTITTVLQEESCDLQLDAETTYSRSSEFIKATWTRDLLS